jgi:methyl-accepting chemotaxis protein
MSVLAIIMSVIGLVGMRYSNSNLQSVYADRLIPVNQLSEIKARQLDNRLKIANSIAFPDEDEKNIAKIEENANEIAKIWENYTSTKLTENEKELVDSFTKNRIIFRDEALLPAIALIKSGDDALLRKHIIEKVRPLFEPLSKGVDDLVQLQVDVAKQEYDSAQSVYNKILIGSIIALILGLGVCVFLSLAIIRNLINSLQSAKSVATAIAHGNFNSKIVIESNDEISSLLHSMQTMQNTITSFVDAQGFMSKKHAEGWIAEKIDYAKFEGSYGSMAKSINDLVQLHINIKMQIVDTVSGYAKGDFKRDFEQLPGDQAKITTAVKAIKSALLAINTEIENLASAGAEGDFSKRANVGGFDFMFKSMLIHLNTLTETCNGAFNDVLRVSNALADGDLTQTITKDYQGVFGKVKIGMNNTTENLKNIVAEIKESSNTISAAATEIAAGNNDLAHRTEQQAAALEETAASMHELTSTVEHNTENAKQANELAGGATEIANKGVSVVKDVVNTMENINESSLRIVDIISVIDDIAFQTNILALNAAVEAARAGEQGKGFAVVATEVRNLAQRAANAAGEIKRLISDSVERVSGGSKQVVEAGKTMQDIVEAIESVTKIIGEIAGASIEQNAGISQVGKAISSMDEVTQQNAALVEQVAATAESLESQTAHLASEMSHFKTDNNSNKSNAMKTFVAPKSAAKSSTPPMPAPAQKIESGSKGTFSVGVDDWEEF